MPECDNEPPEFTLGDISHLVLNWIDLVFEYTRMNPDQFVLALVDVDMFFQNVILCLYGPFCTSLIGD